MEGVDSRLAHVAAIAATEGSTAAAAEGRKSGPRRRREQGPWVVLEATDQAQARDAVDAVGGRVEATSGPLVKAVVRPESLRALAHSPGVGFVRPPLVAHAETVTSEGVAKSGASAWQAASRGGSGVKIAIVDVGFAGYTTRQGEGELPNPVTTVDDCEGNLSDREGSRHRGRRDRPRHRAGRRSCT